MMRRAGIVFLLVGWILFAAVGTIGAADPPPAGKAAAKPAPTVLDKPMRVEFTLALDGEKPIQGDLLRYDPLRLWVKADGTETEFKWAQLSWGSQYFIHAQLIDKKKGSDWLALAELATKLRLFPQVRPDVEKALALDPSLKAKADAVLKAASQRMAVVKFQKATPEQHAKAMETAKKVAAEVEKALHVSFTTLETPHFIIFTNWQDDHEFLTHQCEEAYSAVSEQFDIPVKDNVFVGKLPVFMFAAQKDFARFAVAVDEFPEPVSPNILGYFAPHDDGSGHMAMYMADQLPNVSDPKALFCHTLSHEFTHAFVARYRTNQRIPRWLNEGLAECISSKKYPRKNSYPIAKYMATREFAFNNLFDDNKLPGGEMYPVMQTMVEALIKDNRRGFIRMFNDIKDGVDPEVAMKRQYKATYKDFEDAWRRYAKALAQ